MMRRRSSVASRSLGGRCSVTDDEVSLSIELCLFCTRSLLYAMTLTKRFLAAGNGPYGSFSLEMLSKGMFALIVMLRYIAFACQ